jgi:hypothetical protein
MGGGYLLGENYDPREMRNDGKLDTGLVSVRGPRKKRISLHNYFFLISIKNGFNMQTIGFIILKTMLHFI